ncbi:MAG TPA: 4Fe-4S binding protein [bacterium]|nr:4Fe-4S binding protein [bacterium]
MKRTIVSIDENKCNGCGICVPSCAEGAIKIINGKAKLLADNLCDGLGACLGKCPMDAITVAEREADAYDEAAAHAAKAAAAAPPERHGGCPGSRLMNFAPAAAPAPAGDAGASQLRHWPVKLELVPPHAPFLDGANLVVAADCAAVACASFHRDFLAGNSVVIGCPKLNDTAAYVERLTAIFTQAKLKSVTVVRMEVPCCMGLTLAVQQAVTASGKKLPFAERIIGIRGNEQ